MTGDLKLVSRLITSITVPPWLARLFSRQIKLAIAPVGSKVPKGSSVVANQLLGPDHVYSASRHAATDIHRRR